MAVTGLQQTLNAIRTLEKTVQEDVKDVIEDFTLRILRQAIRNAPSAGENVATTYGTQKIDSNIASYLGSEIVNNGFTGRVFLESGANELAIYLEFGTGVSAASYVPTLSAEWQAIAQRYYVNGRGTLIKHPFLLPAFFDNQFKFVYEMQRVLKSHGIETVVIA